MRRSISKEATNKLIHLMWNDVNANVKKVAAQTLGRTGRGRQVHDEINRRLESSAMFDRLEALKKINFIGIITNRMLSVYLKCFRDDHISVREMACKVNFKNTKFSFLSFSYFILISVSSAFMGKTR
jgi:hypothetical protein